jgi:hypothetical protein
MRTARTVVSLALLAIVASPVFAAPGAKKPATVPYYKTIDTSLKTITLTDDQTTKFDALKKDYEQKFEDAYAKSNVLKTDILTADQKKAGEEASKAAKDAGKKNKELNQAVAEAEKATDEQKVKLKEARASLRTLQAEFKGKVMDLLTDAQKKEIDTGKPKKSGKAAKPAA